MKNRNRHLKHVGDIKDRGSTKWQGMFLVEHTQMLRDYAEELKRTPKPDLDEYDMQLIYEELDLAQKRRCNVDIHTWRDGEVKRHNGEIVNIDIKTRILTYEDPFKQRRLNLDEIVSVNLVD